MQAPSPSLIWVYTVCICNLIRHFGVRHFRTITVLANVSKIQLDDWKTVLQHLIWVCNVCSGLSVEILRVNTELCLQTAKSLTRLPFTGSDKAHIQKVFLSIFHQMQELTGIASSEYPQDMFWWTNNKNYPKSSTQLLSYFGLSMTNVSACLSHFSLHDS